MICHLEKEDMQDESGWNWPHLDTESWGLIRPLMTFKTPQISILIPIISMVPPRVEVCQEGGSGSGCSDFSMRAQGAHLKDVRVS